MTPRTGEGEDRVVKRQTVAFPLVNSYPSEAPTFQKYSVPSARTTVAVLPKVVVFEIEGVKLARHLAPVAQRHLDAGGVQHHVADGEDIAGLIEDDAAAPPLDTEGCRGRPVGRHLDAKADHGRGHPPHIARERGDLLGIRLGGCALGRGIEHGGQHCQHHEPGEQVSAHGYLDWYCFS